MEGIKLILLGPPGAGKGTIANMLRTERGMVALSTGDMLREEVKNRTQSGRKAAEYMNAGKLVPDETVISILKNRIKEIPPNTGFVLDGFPRTAAQAEALEDIFRELGVSLDFVLNLEVPRDVVLQRLSGRRQCSGCGEIYHLKNMPSAREGICDKCGGALFQRNDDREDTVETRLTAYERQTAPLIEFYANRGILRAIKADVGPAETFNEVKKQIL